MLITDTGYYFEKEVEEGSDPQYKVKYYHYEMDSKPTVKFFEFHNDMEDWISEEIQRRVDFTVQHSSDSVSEREYEEIEEYERTLVIIEKIQSCDVNFYAYKGV